MTLLIAVLLHGEDIDLVYFWSSVFMILLPITVFTALTYFVVRGYRRREQGAGSRERLWQKSVTAVVAGFQKAFGVSIIPSPEGAARPRHASLRTPVVAEPGL